MESTASHTPDDVTNNNLLGCSADQLPQGKKQSDCCVRPVAVDPAAVLLATNAEMKPPKTGSEWDFEMETSMMSTTTDSFYDCSDCCNADETNLLTHSQVEAINQVFRLEENLNRNHQSGVVTPRQDGSLGSGQGVDTRALDHHLHFNDDSNSSEYSSLLLVEESDEPRSLWSSNIQHSEEYLDDDSPSDFSQYMVSILEYEDPSLDYQFVNDPTTLSQLDNADALLEQLRAMGINVNRDYLTLDIDFSLSGPNSLQDERSCGSSDSSGGSVGDQNRELFSAAFNRAHSHGREFGDVGRGEPSIEGFDPGTEALATAGRFLRELPSGSPPSGISGAEQEDLQVRGRTSSTSADDDEVVEAYFMPDGNFKVIYDNLSKEYRSRVTPHDDHVRYLQLMHLGDAGPDSITTPDVMRTGSADGSNLNPLDKLRSRLILGTNEIDNKLRQRIIYIRRTKQKLGSGGNGGDSLNVKALREDLKNFALKLPPRLKGLPDHCRYRIRRLLAAEVAVDAGVTTPDSGVHENMAGLSPEEQQKQMDEWTAELAKTEDEIATLRQVLSSKVNHAHELKRRLGITVWRELSDDLNSSLKTVRESQPMLKAGEVFTEFHSAVSAAPLYQKTAGAIGAVGEKTTSLFGGIGAKFGALKETPTFKSFEERVGGVYTAARSKIPGGSGSNSTQDFEEAFKEAEGEKAAAEAAAAGGNPGVVQDGVAPIDPSQQQQLQQQPLS